MIALQEFLTSHVSKPYIYNYGTFQILVGCQQIFFSYFYQEVFVPDFFFLLISYPLW